jgi:hypothetical protein
MRYEHEKCKSDFDRAEKDRGANAIQQPGTPEASICEFSKQRETNTAVVAAAANAEPWS